MKAVRLLEYGGLSALQLLDIGWPAIHEGQVFVEVHAASLNPFDTMIREGVLRETLPLKLPITLGGDIAGIVVDVGPAVSGISVGDKVYGQASVVAGNSGAFAEFASTAAAQVAKIPNNIGFNQAAALPLVGVSALQAMTKHFNLKRGQKICIKGGAGGIGAIAVQLAKHIGVHVAATASGDDIDYVAKLGADEVIDYKQYDFTEMLHNYDAFFDTVGGDDFSRAYAILRQDGVAVSMVESPDEAEYLEHGIVALRQSTVVTTHMLDQLAKLVNSGVITVRIGKELPLEQAQEAFRVRESGTVSGKVVLTIK